MGDKTVNRLLAAAPFAGLLLAACQPTEHKVGVTPVRLDCPQAQGELRRVALAADGKSCDYRSGETEVTLRLTPVVGGPEATLATLESDLRKLRPITPVSDVSTETLTPPEPYDPSAPAPPAPPKPPEPAVMEDDGGDQVDIDIPGLRIKADDTGAKLRIAGVHIDANDQGAEIRRVAYSRLPGEQLSRERRGVKAFFLLAGEAAGPEGYSLVGYEAAGRRQGPLTVAVVRSRESHHNDDADGDGNLFGDDVRALMKRNGG